MILKNVIKDSGEQVKFGGPNDYYGEIFTYLQKHLTDFDSYLFIIYGHNGTKLPISRTFYHPKKVLLWSQGENKLHNIDAIRDDYKLIITDYLNDECTIPLHHSTLDYKPIDISERLYNMSFVGCLNNNRIRLSSLLTRLSPKLLTLGLFVFKKRMLRFISQLAKVMNAGSFFQFNADFNKGLGKEDYLYILQQSKISLCPKGWANAETFRFFESMKLGCVVITEQLPNRWFYKNCPAIQVNSWEEGLAVADKLLTNPKEMQRISDECIRFYKKRLSSNATAKHILKQLHKQ